MGSCLSYIRPVVTSDQTSAARVRNSSGGFRNAGKDASGPGCNMEASCQTENLPGKTETANGDITGSPSTFRNAIENECRMHPPLPHESSANASGLAGSSASSETPPGPHYDFESNRADVAEAHCLAACAPEHLSHEDHTTNNNDSISRKNDCTKGKHASDMPSVTIRDTTASGSPTLMSIKLAQASCSPTCTSQLTTACATPSTLLQHPPMPPTAGQHREEPGTCKYAMLAVPPFFSSSSFDSQRSSTSMAMPMRIASTTTASCSQLHPGVARGCYHSFSVGGAQRCGPRATTLRQGSLGLSLAGGSQGGCRSPVAGTQSPPASAILGRTGSCRGAVGHKRVEAMLGLLQARRGQAEPMQLPPSPGSLQSFFGTTTVPAVGASEAEGAIMPGGHCNSARNIAHSITHSLTLSTAHDRSSCQPTACTSPPCSSPLFLLDFNTHATAPSAPLPRPISSTTQAQAITCPQHPIHAHPLPLGQPPTHEVGACPWGVEGDSESHPALSAVSLARSLHRMHILTQLPESMEISEACGGGCTWGLSTLDSMCPDTGEPPSQQTYLTPFRSYSNTSVQAQTPHHTGMFPTCPRAPSQARTAPQTRPLAASNYGVVHSQPPSLLRSMPLDCFSRSEATATMHFTRRSAELPVRASAAKQALPGVQGMTVSPRGLSHSGSDMRCPVPTPHTRSARLAVTQGLTHPRHSNETTSSSSVNGMGSSAGSVGSAGSAWAIRSCDLEALAAAGGVRMHTRTLAITRMLHQAQSQQQLLHQHQQDQQQKQRRDSHPNTAK